MQEWIEVVRLREEKQIEQSYVPFESSVVRRERRVSEAGDAVGCWKGAGVEATEGVAEAVREGEEEERAALKRARRAFC